MFGKKDSKMQKLPPVRNCFTLAMTNKLVVIINSLKVAKIKENFTIWNEISSTKLQLPPEPLTRGLPPPDPHSPCPLSSTEFVEPPPGEQNSWVRHWLPWYKHVFKQHLHVFIKLNYNKVGHAWKAKSIKSVVCRKPTTPICLGSKKSQVTAAVCHLSLTRQISHA